MTYILLREVITTSANISNNNSAHLHQWHFCSKGHKRLPGFTFSHILVNYFCWALKPDVEPCSRWHFQFFDISNYMVNPQPSPNHLQLTSYQLWTIDILALFSLSKKCQSHELAIKCSTFSTFPTSLRLKTSLAQTDKLHCNL